MVNYSLDLTAYRCPLPLFMAKRAIKLLSVDEQLCIHLHQDAVLKDFVYLCEKHSCQIETLKHNSDNSIILITKK